MNFILTRTSRNQKGFNHKGHNGTQRKTLIPLRVLCVLRGKKFGSGQIEVKKCLFSGEPSLIRRPLPKILAQKTRISLVRYYKGVYQPTLFESSAPYFDQVKTVRNGKIFTLTRDRTGDHHVNVDDLEWQYLKGDGDFRSAEIKALRDEADIIITNPPFSLFREFLAWVIESGKQFVIISN